MLYDSRNLIRLIELLHLQNKNILIWLWINLLFCLTALPMAYLFHQLLTCIFTMINEVMDYLRVMLRKIDGQKNKGLRIFCFSHKKLNSLLLWAFFQSEPFGGCFAPSLLADLEKIPFRAIYEVTYVSFFLDLSWIFCAVLGTTI